MLLTVRDNTAAKEAERLRSDLTNMMVHDLRSPLSSVISSFDLIFRGVIGAITPQQRDVLTIAHASTQKLLNMINLLLDINRLEAGRMPMDLAPLQVDELVASALGSQLVQAASKGLRLEPLLVPGARVHADRELVLRVLQNLLDNALKFSPQGGLVQLVVAPEPGTPRLLRFSVRDAGIGIPQTDQEQIFAKFGQSGNRRSSGSGLGLTFCKLVVENHGGRIWVESSPGRGSCFCFTLPTG
jgi:signal transduction histidine kinase